MSEATTGAVVNARVSLEARARIEREREHHNARFANGDDTRLSQYKYYHAIRDCLARHESRWMDLSVNADVLEYGCGAGEKTLRAGQVARSAWGIDISDVAMDHANRRAQERGLTNVRFAPMNAEELAFEDKSFDLVFGSGILHHLDLNRSFREIARVLRPGGRAVFVEPLFYNPLLYVYRKMTPEAHTPDEHPLRACDVKLARQVFNNVKMEFYGLTTLAAVPVHNTALRAPVFAMTRFFDRQVFKLPGLRWVAWYSFLELSV